MSVIGLGIHGRFEHTGAFSWMLIESEDSVKEHMIMKHYRS
jgi:hypothetical protein